MRGFFCLRRAVAGICHNRGCLGPIILSSFSAELDFDVASHRRRRGRHDVRRDRAAARAPCCADRALAKAWREDPHLGRRALQLHEHPLQARELPLEKRRLLPLCDSAAPLRAAVVRGDGRSATHRPDGRQGASGARRGAPRLAGQALRHERLRESRGDARRRRHQRAVLEDDGGEASGGAVLLRRGGGRHRPARSAGSTSSVGVGFRRRAVRLRRECPPPMCIPSSRTSGAARGPGTPLRPDGQTDAWLAISNWMVGWVR